MPYCFSLNPAYRAIIQYMSPIDQIKIIDNFMNDEDISKIKNYMLTRGYKGEAIGVSFGHDLLLKPEERLLSLDILNEIKDYIIKDYFPKTLALMQEQFDDSKTLYPSVFWMIRSAKGSSVHEHVDGEGNPHFKYSSILYLDTMDDDGVLEFPRINYNYTPKKSDMLLFPAQPEELDHVVRKINSERHTMILWATDDPKFSLV